ncbi:MAG TPA: hypothetical protein VK750_05945 [Cytophagaceae bacterium]|jgi:hypothetical protein|nr:hypothetical protein [Cytophagaceae bacterium]
MKKFYYIFIVIVLAVLLYVSFGHYGEGSIAGTLVKLTKKGIIFHTYEGKLNTQMFVGEGSSASGLGLNLWDFTVVKNDSLIAKLEDAMLNGHRVKLDYKQRFFTLPWIGDTKYIVYSAEVLDQK